MECVRADSPCLCEGFDCYYDDVHGHWAGDTCYRCADWYYSVDSGCNTPTRTKYESKTHLKLSNGLECKMFHYRSIFLLWLSLMSTKEQDGISEAKLEETTIVVSSSFASDIPSCSLQQIVIW